MWFTVKSKLFGFHISLSLMDCSAAGLMKITLLRVHTQELGEWLPDFWGCQVTFFHKRAKEQSGMNSLRKDRLFCNQSTCHPPSITKTPNASGLLIVIGIRQSVPPSYQCYAWQSRRLPAVTGFKKTQVDIIYTQYLLSIVYCKYENCVAQV